MNNSEEKVMQEFADLMIKKIEKVSYDWKQPWFTDGVFGAPENIDGRGYDRLNSLMLALLCDEKGYRVPVFVTFNRIQKLNENAPDKERIMITKGEKSFPVGFYKFICKDLRTGENIEIDEYNKLSKDMQANYKTYPIFNSYRVFNIGQTNMETARPELWKKLDERCNGVRPEVKHAETWKFPAMDKIIDANLWICPIKRKYQNNAYFSLTLNEITVPEKEQFTQGEAFYGTLWHEMAHSTGPQLKRIQTGSFGSKDYAREELVAELSAAMVARKYGIGKVLEQENAQYLKCWLRTLKEEPKFIKTILKDVNKAAEIITNTIDAIVAISPAA